MYNTTLQISCDTYLHAVMCIYARGFSPITYVLYVGILQIKSCIVIYTLNAFCYLLTRDTIEYTFRVKYRHACIILYTYIQDRTGG